MNEAENGTDWTKFFPIGRIMRSQRKGAAVCIYDGEPEVGKSSAMINTIITANLWDRDEVKYSQVRSLFCFKLSELVELLHKAYDIGQPWPCVGWDDAGIWGSRYLSRHIDYYTIQTLLDLIRTSTRGLVLTCIDFRELAKIVRERRFFYSRFFATSSKYRVIVRNYRLLGYKDWYKRVSPDEGVFEQLIKDVRMPDQVFAVYCAERNRYIDEWRKAMKMRGDYKQLKERLGIAKMQRLLDKYSSEISEVAKTTLPFESDEKLPAESA